MRPVGPEPSETYWMRRALVVGAFLVLLIIILLFLFNLGGRPGQAAPAGTPSVAPTGNASSDSSTETSAAPSSASSGSPSDASASAESPSPSASASTSASSRPSADSTAAGKASPSSRSDEKSDEKSDDKKSAESDDTDTAKKPDESKKSEEKEDGGKKQDESKADSKKDERPKPRYADCDPKKLRATIKSDKHNVGVRDKVTFELSVINGGETPCTLDLNDKNYELKIYSGTDRIWSSNDCTKIEPKLHKIMQPEQQVEWSITWNGKRSDEDAKCKARPEIPRPGYYYATSAIKGAKPVQFLLVLR